MDLLIIAAVAFGAGRLTAKAPAGESAIVGPSNAGAFTVGAFLLTYAATRVLDSFITQRRLKGK